MIEKEESNKFSVDTANKWVKLLAGLGSIILTIITIITML